MVTAVTSLTGNGLRDWLLQRATAIVIAAYVVIVIGFMMCNSPMTFSVWQHFFQCSLVRMFSILFLFSLAIHAWIGVWTVTTDYLNCACIRLLVQGAFACMLFLCLIWGVDIFWGM